MCMCTAFCVSIVSFEMRPVGHPQKSGEESVCVLPIPSHLVFALLEGRLVAEIVVVHRGEKLWQDVAETLRDPPVAAELDRRCVPER